MNLDDESHLSAYLDDELDPADRLVVEWSIESNPTLAEQLRSLASARDAVAGLGRPAIPRDLAPALGARLAADRRRARLRLLVRPARVAAILSGFTAVAASLIFALILLNHPLHDTFDIAKTADKPAAQVAGLRGSNPRSIPNPTLDQKPTRVVSRVNHSASPSLVSTLPVPKLPSVELNRVDEARERQDRKALAGMLERPNVRRIVIVTDVIDASDRINRLIHQDARKSPDYGRITIAQDIIIDPDRPEAAEVYAVPTDESGRRSFVEKLTKMFPDLVEEVDSDLALVTQLTEVGQVALFRGTEAAPLGDPPHDLRQFVASRDEHVTDHVINPDLPDIEASGSANERPRAAAVASTEGGSAIEFVGPPAPPRKAPLKPNDPVTVLVWVTRPTHQRY